MNEVAVDIRVAHDAGVIFPDAFGFAGRAGGVHEPCAGSGRDFGELRAGEISGDVLREFENFQRRGRKMICERKIVFVSEQQARLGIGEHRGEAIFGMRGVEDEIHFAGFERAENGGDERRAVVHEQRDGRGRLAEVIAGFPSR